MKDIHIYNNHETTAPVVYLNVFQGDGSDIWEACEKMNLPPVTLAVVSGLRWNEELSPWEAEPLFKDERFLGKADEYIREMKSEIMPYVRETIGEEPLWSAIAGYSLAGLFAVYAGYQMDDFKAVASVSGSLWFPDFTEYMEAHMPFEKLTSAYFSLGSKEHKVRNPVMSQVLDKTLQAKSILEKRGLKTVFETNPGNHFTDPGWRMAKGIAWILNHTQ